MGWGKSKRGGGRERGRRELKIRKGEGGEGKRGRK